MTFRLARLLVVALCAAVSAAPALADGRPTMGVSGITGSLNDVEAHRALDPRMGAFAQCFFDHADELQEAGGEVRLRIRVGTDGRVVSAFPEASTVGHRGVERCLGDVAMRTRFPRPRGGEAYVSWPITLDVPEDGRGPRTWGASRVRRVVRRHGAEAMAQCGITTRARVTAYVRGGRIVSLGAAVADEVPSAALDCLAEQVGGWRMPGGRRLAKVTFELTPGPETLALAER